MLNRIKPSLVTVVQEDPRFHMCFLVVENLVTGDLEAQRPGGNAQAGMADPIRSNQVSSSLGLMCVSMQAQLFASFGAPSASLSPCIFQ